MGKGKQATPCKWCGQEGHLTRRCPHKERMIEFEVNAGQYKVKPFWKARLVAVDVVAKGLKSLWKFVVRQDGRLFLHEEVLHLPAMTLPAETEAEYLMDMYWALRKAAGAKQSQTITDLDNLKIEKFQLYYPLPFEDSLREIVVSYPEYEVVPSYGNDIVNVKFVGEGVSHDTKVYVDPSGQHWVLAYLTCEVNEVPEECQDMPKVKAKTKAKAKAKKAAPKAKKEEPTHDLPF